MYKTLHIAALAKEAGSTTWGKVGMLQPLHDWENATGTQQPCTDTSMVERLSQPQGTNLLCRTAMNHRKN